MLDFSPDAQWITAPGAENKKNSFVRFYRSFELESVPENLPLAITAESYYLLWINGRQAARGPIRGTASLHYFDCINAAEYLHCGVNHLAVLVHTPGEENFVAAPGTNAPALLLELAGVLVSDDKFKAQFAADYLNSEEYFSKQTGFMEDRDLTLAPDDRRWTRGLDGAADWLPAEKITPFLPKKLLLRNIPQLVSRRIIPVSAVRTANVEAVFPSGLELYKQLAQQKWSDDAPERFRNIGTLLTAQQNCTVMPAADGSAAAVILDLGQDYTGYPEMLVECSEPGAMVYVTYGEALISGQRIRLDYENDIYGFTDRYRLTAGLNTLGSALCERGGRYIQMIFHNFTAPLTIREVRFREHRYDLGEAGAFRCSDDLLNTIWERCSETLRACTTDVFTDCPWRERSFWVNDLIVENRTSLAAFGALALHRRAFELAFSQQRADGWIPGVCPAPQEKSLKWVLPATNLFLFMMLKDYYMCSGDLETVVQYLPNLEKILQAVEKYRAEDGTVMAPPEAWHFYDWGFEFTDHSFRRQRESMFCFLYSAAIDIYLEFMQCASRQCDRSSYIARRDQAVAGAYLRFTDRASGLLADDYCFYHYHENAPATVGKVSTQLAHALALLCAPVPEELQKSFAAALSNEKLLKPDLYLQSFVLRALNKVHNDAAALERIRLYWGKVVADGGQTIYENAVAKFGHELQECGSTGSMCHGFATAPLEFLQISTLGIKALTPGFRRFAVDPRPVDLSFAEGRVPTPQGNIYIKYQKISGNWHLELQVPGGCIAVLSDKRELGSGWHELKLKSF